MSTEEIKKVEKEIKKVEKEIEKNGEEIRKGGNDVDFLKEKAKRERETAKR